MNPARAVRIERGDEDAVAPLLARFLFEPVQLGVSALALLGTIEKALERHERAVLAGGGRFSHEGQIGGEALLGVTRFRCLLRRAEHVLGIVDDEARVPRVVLARRADG